MTKYITPPAEPPGYGFATAINEAGVVAGFRVDPQEHIQDAFTWKDGVMTSLGISDIPVAINRSGEVALGDGVWRNGVVTPLGVLPGFAGCIAESMNDKAQVVGSCYTAVALRAFLWDNGVMTDLGTLGGRYSQAHAINNHGEVVGTSNLAGDTDYHAFRWKDGVMTDLGTMGGRNSEANAINNLGEIAGQSDEDRPACGPNGYWLRRPFIWRRRVWTPIHFQDQYLDCFGTFFVVYGLSDAGHVVGYYFRDMRNVAVAFVWHDGVDLALGTDAVARSVNASGQIAGYEVYPGSRVAAVLWTVGRHGP